MPRPRNSKTKKPAKEKLLEAAFQLVREKGYSATTVDDLCKKAKVTKGTFFHYFENKEAYAVEAAQYWSKFTNAIFENADYQENEDPLDRFLGYLNFRKQILKGETAEFTCLVGTMVQEAHSSHPDIRTACKNSIFGHAETLELDIEAAKKIYAPKAKWSSKSLALHSQAVIQGAFIIAKAGNDSRLASESIEHFENYVRLLFKKEKTNGK